MTISASSAIVAYSSPSDGGLRGTPPPIVTANPSGLIFQQRVIDGATQALTTILTNAGPGEATIYTPFIIGNYDFSIAQESCANVTLKPNKSCSITVVFTPRTIGYQDTDLHIPFEQVSPIDIQVAGQVLPKVSFSPNSAAFGNVPVDHSSPASIWVINNDSHSLSIHSVAISDGNTGDFMITRDLCTGQSVGANQSCQIDLNFVPTTTGPRSATLVVNSSSTSSPDSASLSGTGTSRLVIVRPYGIGFGNVVVNTSSPVELETVTNNDPINSITVGHITSSSPQVAITDDQCTNLVLAPNGTCTFGVQFTPTSIESMREEIFVPDSSDYRAAQFAVSGFGTTSLVDSFPQTIDFGTVRSGTHASQSFQIRNWDSLSTFNWTNRVEVNTGLTADPTIEVPSGCFPLSPGQACTLTLGVTPQSPGVISGVIAIIGDAQSGELDLPFTVDAVAPQLSAPATLTFPVQRAGSTAHKTLTIYNVGTAPMTVNALRLYDSHSLFTADANNCQGASIGSGASCTIQLSFTPARSGNVSAGLVVTSDGGQAQVELDGIGDGDPPVIEINSSKPVYSHALGDQLQGTATDDFSGVAHVVVTYQNLLPTIASQSFIATLQCGARATSCTWTAPLPSLAGLWTASVFGTDKVGNVDPEPATAKLLAI